MQNQAKVGPVQLSEGAETSLRVDRQSAQVVTDAHGRYHEAAVRGNVFTAYMDTTSTTTAAGNLKGASAAAVTNFCVWNPANSGKVLSLLKFNFALHSGTPTAGPVWHGVQKNHAISISSTAGVLNNNYIGGGQGSVAGVVSVGTTGTALTGGVAPVLLRPAAFTLTAVATPGTTVLGTQNALELLDGDIVIGPGMAWVPLLVGAGTTTVWSASLTWEEIPV